MKKLHLILGILFSFIISSCSQNNKTEIDNSDPLIGTWKMTRTADVRIDKTERSSPPSECFAFSRFIYKNDGTLYYKRVNKSPKSETCIEVRKDFWTGTWQRKTNGNYTFEYTHKYSDKNIYSHTNSTNAYTFSKDKNTLKIYDDYEASGTSFPDGIIVANYMILERVID